MTDIGMKSLNEKYYYSDGTTSEERDYTKTLHRIDGPASERWDGSKFWYYNGILHREDGPAAEFSNGDKEWWVNGRLHRVDGPAEEFENGDALWYLDGVFYKEIDHIMIIGKIRQMPLELRLTDPREWVRRSVASNNK